MACQRTSRRGGQGVSCWPLLSGRSGAAHRAAIEQLPEELERVAGFHAGWWEADGRPVSCAGKTVRPALTLACARAAGDADGRAAVAAAVAVELVHDFSLLHDDVMDRDELRRHRRAAWTVFGVGTAVLTGDALVVLAMDLLGRAASSVAPLKVLSGALLELCAGQSADLTFEARSEVSLTECLAMAEGKTGALLGAACELGALAGGADLASAHCYRRFGRNLGVAYQLVDDLLGIWGDPQITGKPVGSDLVSRKKSLPVVAALGSGSPAGDELARTYRDGREMDQAAVQRLADLVEQAGGRQWVQDEQRRRTRAAMQALADAKPAPGGTADLAALTTVLTHREC